MKPIRIVTHSGTFHADELFAIAILLLALKGNVEIIRSRDPEVFATADYLIDVGGEYNPATKRFDHHQSGGAGKRSNGIPYASCGLLWKEFGEQLCGSREVAKMVEDDLIQVIDAEDNGIESFAIVSEYIHPFAIGRVIQVYNATWKEDPKQNDTTFLNMIPIIQDILKHVIKFINDKKEAEDIVRDAYLFSPDKRIIILEDAYPANDVLAKYKEPLYIIKYRKVDNTWGVHAVRDDMYSYKNRKDFPKEWGGKTSEELQQITGVPDATFCHSGLFLAVAKSKEGAIALAELAVEA